MRLKLMAWTTLQPATHFVIHGKSLIMDETDGFVKLLADKSTGEILGASAVGPDA